MEVDDPRLAPGLRELEKLKQDHFGEGADFMNSFGAINFISRVAGESGQYLLGSYQKATLPTGQEGHHEPFRTQMDVRCILSVPPTAQTPRKYLILGVRSVLLVGLNEQERELQKITSSSNLPIQPLSSRHVSTTPKHVYVRKLGGNGILRLDWTGSELDTLAEGFVQDFFVCPKTETITTLNKEKEEYLIQRNDKRIKVNRGQTEPTILKKMYSDHFLVGETNRAQARSFGLQLWDNCRLRVKHYVEFSTKPSGRNEIQNIRLLAPRQGINCFLVLMICSLELFCEYRLKLYHLKTLEIKKLAQCLSCIFEGLWMIGGMGNTLLSVRVDFSKCPALQL